MYINNLQNGDLLFMRDNSDFSKAIIDTTKEYSHVEIFFDNMIYHVSRKLGVTKQKIDEFLNEGTWGIDIYRYPEIDCEIIHDVLKNI